MIPHYRLSCHGRSIPRPNMSLCRACAMSIWAVRSMQPHPESLVTSAYGCIAGNLHLYVSRIRDAAWRRTRSFCWPFQTDIGYETLKDITHATAYVHNAKEWRNSDITSIFTYFRIEFQGSMSPQKSSDYGYSRCSS